MNWIGRKVTGQHSGILKLSEGSIILENSTINSGLLVFDMKTIQTTDIESIGGRRSLDSHLMNEDFFFVDSFPKAYLTIKKSSLINLHLVNPTNFITADLTIRGITNEISFPISIVKSESSYSASGTIDVDRTLYNIRYKSNKFFSGLGDRIIYDNFTVQFEVKAD